MTAIIRILGCDRERSARLNSMGRIMKALCITVGVLCLAGSSLFVAPIQVAQDAGAVFQSGRNPLSVKLAVNSAVDQSANAHAVTAVVDHMAQDVSASAGGNAGSAAKLAALKRYLCESDPWNNNIAFQYHQTDPLGQSPPTGSRSAISLPVA